MRGNPLLKTTCGIICSAMASLIAVNAACADGTDQLGPPSISTADSSEIVAAGQGAEWCQKTSHVAAQ
jgi:hypothetical protein